MTSQATGPRCLSIPPTVGIASPHKTTSSRSGSDPSSAMPTAACSRAPHVHVPFGAEEAQVEVVCCTHYSRANLFFELFVSADDAGLFHFPGESMGRSVHRTHTATCFTLHHIRHKSGAAGARCRVLFWLSSLCSGMPRWATHSEAKRKEGGRRTMALPPPSIGTPPRQEISNRAP